MIISLVLVLFMVSSCAAGSEKFTTETAGFLMGIWHGFISLFVFVASLFVDGLDIYEKNNNGNWYNFGFILGIMMFYGGGGKGACGRRK
jgi:hypothetical protein